MDILDQITLPAFHETLGHMVPMDSVNFLVCFAYSELDLLTYSSYCVAISSIAVAMRGESDSFDGVFLLLSLTDIALGDDITKCTELLYEKLQKFPHLFKKVIE